MKTRSLSILALLFLSVGAYAQSRGNASPRINYSTAPSRGSSPSYSSGNSSSGGGYGTRSSSGSTYSTGSSESSRPSSSGSSTAPSRSNGSSGSSSGSSSSSGSYTTYPYYNNSPYYGSGGGSTGIGNSSPSSSGGGITGIPDNTPDNTRTTGANDEQVRNTALAGIRQTLANLDKSTQSYRVSGTEPSTITGMGGTKMNINPKDLETVDGQPISGDIDVNLKELDGAEKMGLAGTPTMSNGEMLVSGGSYYFGMSSGGKEVKLKEGKSMEVQLPKLAKTEPGMQIFTGQVDKAGNVNWVPTNKPLTGALNSTPNPNSGNETPSGSGNGTGNGSENGTVTGPGREGNGNTPPTRNDNNGSSTGNSGVRNNGSGNAPASNYYAPISITSMGYVNADKFMRGGVKMIVEVENADPAATQVYLVFKNVRSLVEGQPERGFVSNNFLFNSVPKNEDIKVVAVSKSNGKTFVGEVYGNTKTKRQYVTLAPIADDELSKVFKYNAPQK